MFGFVGDLLTLDERVDSRLEVEGGRRVLEEVELAGGGGDGREGHAGTVARPSVVFAAVLDAEPGAGLCGLADLAGLFREVPGGAEYADLVFHLVGGGVVAGGERRGFAFGEAG